LEHAVEQVRRGPGRQPHQEEYVDSLFVDLAGGKPLDVTTAISHHVRMVLRDRSKLNDASDRAAAATDAATDAARRALAAMIRDGAVPGMSFAVVRHDRVLFAEAFGWADLGRQLPAVPATSYLWFSMTKIATATAAMRLADEGRLDLDAPVSEAVDWLRRPEGVQPSMRQLLTHTSGLGNPVPIRWVHPAEHAGPDQETMLRRMFGRRRAFRYPTGRVA